MVLERYGQELIKTMLVNVLCVPGSVPFYLINSKYLWDRSLTQTG